MVHNWLLYIAAFACAFAISMVTTPLAKKISEKLGAIDYPKAKRNAYKTYAQIGRNSHCARFYDNGNAVI